MNITFDINNILRTVAGAAVGLTVAIPLAGQLQATTALTQQSLERTEAQNEVRLMKDTLTRRCYEWLWSKVDSKLERTAKNEIDEYFNGEVDYGSVCRVVLG
jgi:hypothetical protein